MKLKEMTVGSHELRQFHFRVNIKEIEAMLTAIEIANAVTPKSPVSDSLKPVRQNLNNVKRSLAEALKELDG